MRRSIRPRFLLLFAIAVAGLVALLAFQVVSAPVNLRERGVYLVPLGDFPPEMLEEFEGYYERRYRLDATVLGAVPLDDEAVDEVRGQYVAEDLARLVWKRYRKPSENRRAVVIGLTEEDMYMRGYPVWNFVFGYRWPEGGYAVVSTARMNPENFGESPDAALLMERLRKMVTKQIGVLYLGLPLSDDPTSVLYTPLSVDDLDRMGEELSGPVRS